jgi:hypothetical protein
MNITVPMGTPDHKLFTGIIDQGIDAHLEAFTLSKFDYKSVNGQPRLVMDFIGKDLPILIRRLEEIGHEDGNEEADSWAIDIQNAMNEECEA